VIYAVGGLPDEVTDVDLCERFGWTPSQLDGEDMARVLPGIYGANARDGLRRIKRYLDTQGQYKPSEDDWNMYGWVLEQMGGREVDR